MPLLTLRNICLGFGHQPLLDHVDLTIEPGERIALVGRNGAGKSTLLRLLEGKIEAEEGQIVRRDGLCVASLEQNVPAGLQGSVYDVVAAGLGELGGLLAEYHRFSMKVAAGDEQAMTRLGQIQHQLESGGGWQIGQQVETVLSRLDLPAESDFATLSGGLKRRVLLARALVRQPDLLLLDEPTNHLDIGAIEWLEQFMTGFPGSLLFITHDRVFLQNLATRIIELDRGRLTSWPGDYQAYVQRKQAALEAETAEQAEFDKKLAREEAWIRQGIKARRTRNEGRVRALKRMREERRARRECQGRARMQVNQAEHSGQRVIEAEDVSFGYAGRPVVSHLNTSILRGDRVGIIGPNGSGKTTLLKLLLGELTPQQGRVRLGTRLDVVYFDQHRAQLDEDRSVLDNVSLGRDTITINGQSRHIISYLQDFLFTPAQARGPISKLSGGERNRLLLARLFTRPCNLLVLDEPTNDLDAETLELLEERLLEFPGTLLLVSHDRAFLDHVVTSTLVLEGNGRVDEYVGGYDDWLRQRKKTPGPKMNQTVQAASARPAVAKTNRRDKLGYKEQRELDALPQRIEELEEAQADLHALMSNPDFYKQNAGEISRARTRLADLEQALTEAYARWEQLESR